MSELKAVDYIILSADTKKEMMEKVREWIKKDFEPQGGPFVMKIEEADKICQAIVKRVRK